MRSDDETTMRLQGVTNPPGQRRAQKREKHRSGAKRAVRAIVAGATAVLIGGGAGLLGASSASAGVGGGGSSGGNTGPSASDFWLFTDDDYTGGNNPEQGWGQDSINFFADAMEDGGKNGWANGAKGRDAINTACGDAIREAIRRGGTKARVIQVGTGINTVGSKVLMGWGGGTRDHMIDWYNDQTRQNAWQKYLKNYPQAALNIVHDTFISHVPNNPTVVCVALNDTEPVMNYTLGVSTDKSSTFSMAGSTNSVSDVIHTTNNGSSIRENLNARVYLNWDGPEGQHISEEKDVQVPNNGDTTTPGFSPQDLGFPTWPAGNFWFDVVVDQQGRMNNSVNTPDRDDRESWNAAPVPPTKIITHGGTTNQLADSDTLASGMTYDARISANANSYTSQMSITDTLDTDKAFIGANDHDIAQKAYVLDPNGNTVNGAQISIDRNTAGKISVTGTVSGLQQGTYTLVVPTYVLPTGSDYTLRDHSQVCYTPAKNNCLTGNDKVTRKVTPAPDKVWLIDPSGALTTADPDKTNQQGADTKVFLPGDAVAAVVNGHIAAHLADPLSSYSITDDWTKSAPYVDFSDASTAKVYLDDADVTDQFDISVQGTKTVAVAKKDSAFLVGSKGLAQDAKVKLVLSGAFRTDYQTHGETVSLTNGGSETWNNETVPTNEPPVFTWTPDPHKQVLGSADQSGDKAHDDINNLSVYPGQKLEYTVQADLHVPANTAYGVKSLALKDVYDAHFTPNKGSVEIFDNRSEKVIPRSAYQLTWDDTAHTFTAEFTPAWIAKNVTAQAQDSEWIAKGAVTLRFDGTVNSDAADASTISNQAFQIVNGVSTATEIPVVNVPGITPHKEDLSTDNRNIDGKTVVKGDHIVYRLTLDGGPARDQLAYNVHKLGMVDDFDDEYLDLAESAVHVTDKNTGEDVTGKFTVQVKDGVMYVFAKQVDSVNANGQSIPGEPQPDDLAAYAKAPIDGNMTPIIDQSLLGRQFWVTMDTTVKKVTDGYTIKNQATENIENTYHQTEIVSNPEKDINPSKDVVVDEAGKDTSLNGKEIPLHDTFTYRLNSSVIPANRAYDVSSWSLSDTFDATHDEYTGVWAIYANTDIDNGQELLFKKGALLQDSAGHESAPWAGLFTVTWDEKTHTFVAAATPKMTALLNTRPDLADAFSIYTQMHRIAPSPEVDNVTTEAYNSVSRESNMVKTNTPEHPAVSLIKYTLKEGTKKGDHNSADDAYALSKSDLKDGTLVGIDIANTGDVPLDHVAVTDATNADLAGHLENIICEVPMPEDTVKAVEAGSKSTAAKTVTVAGDAISTLAVGQKVSCVGTLVGVKAGQTHGDTATVTGQSIYSHESVTASDPWFAKAAADAVTPPAPQKHTAITGEEIVSQNPWLIGGGVALIALAIAALVVAARRSKAHVAAAETAHASTAGSADDGETEVTDRDE